jgi:hypothetical protein
MKPLSLRMFPNHRRVHGVKDKLTMALALLVALATGGCRTGKGHATMDHGSYDAALARTTPQATAPAAIAAGIERFSAYYEQPVEKPAHHRFALQGAQKNAAISEMEGEAVPSRMGVRAFFNGLLALRRAPLSPPRETYPLRSKGSWGQRPDSPAEARHGAATRSRSSSVTDRRLHQACWYCAALRACSRRTMAWASRLWITKFSSLRPCS